MSAPVDVLNMLRKFERTCMLAGLKEEATDLATIFSAVSELIDAANGYFKQYGNCGAPIQTQSADRLTAVLDRVGAE